MAYLQVVSAGLFLIAAGVILMDTSKFISVFKYDSSPVDWCEDNYSHHEYISEFWNTISNMPFILHALAVGYYYNRQEVHRLDGLVWLLPLLYLGIGLGSTYFHGTLSVAGQVLDELPIILFGLYASAILLPVSSWKDLEFRNQLLASRYTFISLLSILLVCMTYPIVSHILCVSTMPGFSYLTIRNYMDFKKSKSQHLTTARNLLACGFFTFFLAFTCWIVDRVFCNEYTALSQQYLGFRIELHALWHVLMSIMISFVLSFGIIIKFSQEAKPIAFKGVNYNKIYAYVEI